MQRRTVFTVDHAAMLWLPHALSSPPDRPVSLSVVYFFISKKIILSGTVPVFFIECFAKMGPADIGAALRDSADGPGLHNAGALIMKASPETARLPMTALGVPILEQMSRAQRDAFLQLLNRRRPPAAAL